MIYILLFLLVILLVAIAVVYNKRLFGGVDPPYSDPQTQDLNKLKIKLNAGINRSVNAFTENGLDSKTKLHRATDIETALNTNYEVILASFKNHSTILKTAYRDYLRPETYEYKYADDIQYSIYKLYKCLPQLKITFMDDLTRYKNVETKIMELTKYIDIKTINDIEYERLTENTDDSEKED